MTKELRFTEEEIYKGMIGGLAASCSALLLIMGRYIVSLFKRKDKNIEKRISNLEKTTADLQRTTEVLKSSIKEIKEALIFKDSSGKNTTLKEKVSEVNHRLINKDFSEASAFDEILERLDLMDIRIKSRKRNKDI